MEMIEETNQVQQFLDGSDPKKQKRYILMTIRDETKRVLDHENFLIGCIELALEQLQDELFLLPEEKFKFERVVPFLLVIADGDVDSGKQGNVFKNGKLKVKEVQRFFQTHIVCPLHMDIHLTLEPILHLAANYNLSKRDRYGATPSREACDTYDVELFWEPIRSSYTDYMARIASALHKYRKYPFEKSVDDVSIEVSFDAYHLVMQGLRYLSSWSTILRQLLAWKFTHPREASSIPVEELEVLVDGSEYAQALRFNFSEDETRYVVDILFMIKSVAREMLQAQAVLADYLRFHIHHAVQQMIQGDLLPLLHRLDKRNKPILPTLINIRSMAVDWLNGIEKTFDYREYTRKQGRVLIKEHPARVVPPSSSQHFVLRMEIASLFDAGSEVRSAASVFSKTDLEGPDVELFESFYHASFFYPYILDYPRYVREITDFSCLWMREHFLEMGRSVQFPIDVSMPWVLTSCLLANAKANPLLIEKALYVLDIYNDAAARVLHHMNEQYLYDEIEAEANLVVDQFVFLLGDEVYDHFKAIAASMVLDQGVRAKMEELKGTMHLRVTHPAFCTLLQQQSVQLLGRSVNLSYILTQSMMQKLHRDIDVAIERFEAGDARGIVDLHQLLKILRTLHALLSQYFRLDDFDQALHEVDESFSPTGFKGRISLHLGSSIATDLLPNFAYNVFTERFIPSPVAVRPKEYKKGPKQSAVQTAYGAEFYKAFDVAAKMHRGFFGRLHLETLAAGLDAKVVILPMIVDQLLKFVCDKLIDISEYLEALAAAIDLDMRVPGHARMTSQEFFGYFQRKLLPLLSFDDLKPEVFQNFREVGNALALFKDLSSLLQLKDWRDAGVLAGVTTLFPMAQRESQINPAKVIVDIVAQSRAREDTDSCAHSLAALDKVPVLIERQLEIMAQTFQNADDGGSVFRWVLGRLEEHLYQQNLTLEWSLFGQLDQQRKVQALSPVDKYRAQMQNVYQTKSFARIWAQLVFLFCLEDEEDEDDLDPDELHDRFADDLEPSVVLTNAGEFGHGFMLAGTVLLHILKQKPAYDLLDVTSRVCRLMEYEHLHPDLAAVRPSGQQPQPASAQPSPNLNLYSQQQSRFYSTSRKLHDVYRLVLQTMENAHEGKASYTRSSIDRTTYKSTDLFA